jgi:DNA-binding NarL/FixJ family response regulator
MPLSPPAGPSSHGPDDPPVRPFRIMVLKWDLLYADAIRRVARDVFPDAEILVCRSGETALHTLRDNRADLGLFGLTLPDTDGLDLLTLVGEELLVHRLLIISGRRDERSRQALRGARIDGFFDAFSEDGAALAVAIRCVGNGGSYFSPSAREFSHGPAPGTRLNLNQVLSLIELQVFSVIGDGSDDESAGTRLGMSAQTVHSHRRAIMRKLGVQTRTELMKAAIQRGIVRITTDNVIRPGFDRLLGERDTRGHSLSPLASETFGSAPSPRESGDAH